MVIMVKYKTVSLKKDQIAALYFTMEFWKLRNSAELETEKKCVEKLSSLLVSRI